MAECVHHWVIDSPGAIQVGKCKRCGASREFVQEEKLWNDKGSTVRPAALPWSVKFKFGYYDDIQG